MTTANYVTVPTYTPTWEEFSNFEKYIETIETEAAQYGVCKVIPPAGWKPNEKYVGKEEEIDFPIQTAIIQHTTGAKGVYLQMHEEVEDLPIRFAKFRNIITEPPTMDKELQEQSTPSQEFSWLERKYWKNILFQPAIYASDIPGSLFEGDVCKTWNLQNLDTVLQKQFKKHNVCIPGVNSPFLYVGSYKSTFCWHTEDMELYSINYLHFGAPKTWYSIPLGHKKKFEDLARSMYPEEFKKCAQVLRHKNLLISPSVLSQNNIQVTKTTQQVGEFMITFPGGYHAGFNHGLNCAEATNFATRRWIQIGKEASRCVCDSETVNIDMENVFSIENEVLNAEGQPITGSEPIDFQNIYLGDFKIDFVKNKKRKSTEHSSNNSMMDTDEEEQPSTKKRRNKKKQNDDEDEYTPTPNKKQIKKSPSQPVTSGIKIRLRLAQPLQGSPNEKSSQEFSPVKPTPEPCTPISPHVTIQIETNATRDDSNPTAQQTTDQEPSATLTPDATNDVATGKSKKKPAKKAEKKAEKTKKEKAPASTSSKKKHHPLFAQFYSGSMFGRYK
ncbi:lysine-specific demethylase [Acrasis kona]|uniref:Lysine-specific demethylase n=1 Tax=Acrasis kona TaxID=1008807 RepID=A0AAW2YYC6_9EUKA